MEIGIIGYGSRMRELMQVMRSVSADWRIAAVTDIRIDEIRAELRECGLDLGQVRYYEQVEDMLDQEKLNGICIGTRCSLHAQMALKVLSANVPIFLEKPVATTMEDLLSLYRATQQDPAINQRILVSFPLRGTQILQTVRELILSGKIGEVEHVQAVNNVPYGSVYFHNWYRDERETGGLFLQKASHDFDYINYILGIRPVRIGAMISKQVFKGDKPAGLTCAACDEQTSCPESPANVQRIQEKVKGPYCCYASDTGNEDSGSALIAYETGMHVSYSQNFYTRKKAGFRGARFIGYKGTLEFDWRRSHEIQVFLHDKPQVETYRIERHLLPNSHNGGDVMLAENFIRMMRNESSSAVPLEAGLISALMCLNAKLSAQEGTFRSIEWPD